MKPGFLMGGIIISGMHNSGVAEVRSLLTVLSGESPKEDLSIGSIGSDNNPEDSHFIRINEAWLSCDIDPCGEPTGWCRHVRESISGPGDEEQMAQASRYCEERGHREETWVVGDPLACLTMPVWSSVPDVTFLFVYDSPWEVVNRLMRQGEPFSGRADWVLRVWASYTRHVLKAVDALGSRAMVVSAGSLARNPGRFYDVVSELLGIESLQVPIAPEPVLGGGRERVEGSHISRLYQILHPEVTELLENLDNAATIPRQTTANKQSVVYPGGAAPTRQAVQVIIPCRDDGQYLSESIASVEEAAEVVSFPVEITLVDGASTDPTTLMYFSRLKQAGYQVIREATLGPSAARNAGLRQSKAAAVIPLDADNILYPALIHGAGLVLENRADVVFGGRRVFGLVSDESWPNEVIDWNAFFPNNTVDNCAAISRKLLRRIGPWDEEISGMEDWDLWLRALRRKARFHRLDTMTFEYFVRPGSILWHLAEEPSLADKAFLRVARRHVRWLKRRGADTTPWEDTLKAHRRA